MAKGKRIRVVVIDDSAYNRRAIMEMLESVEDIAVIGTAADGEEGLKVALALKPDAITLDLDMPNMDGFTFLRLLMAQASIPVIVISGYARSADVFKALELGAIDFIAKPARHFSPETQSVRDELVQKLGAVRLLRRGSLARAGGPEDESGGEGGPMRVALVGASTGGPPALQRLLSSLPADLPLGVAIAQHMPERFTHAFAERLNRLSALEVVEARAGDLLTPGRALIAPGGHTMRLVAAGDGLRVALSEGTEKDRYLPSIDALLESGAGLGPRAAGVILTGMGNDGRAGMLALKKAGATTIAESEETAIIYGMPKEAIEAGAARHVLPLGSIAEALARFSRGLAV